jgi:hypothetical protein
MLATRPGVQSLMALENAGPDILFEHAPGSPIPLWPQVRYSIAMALEHLDIDLEPVAGAASGNKWVRLVSALAPSSGDVRMPGHQREVAFLVGGSTVVGTPKGVRNWLVGDFVDTMPDRSVILQWMPLPAQPEHPAFRPTLGLDPLLTRAAVRARLSPLSSQAETAVRRIVTELVRRVDARLTDDHAATIAQVAIAQERLRPHVERSFGRVMDRVQPRLVLMEDAAYGWWASLIALMKARGVRVIEPQHGWIGPSHAAYNYGEAARRPELLATIPDELLTFGDFWSHSVRFPGLVTAIGKANIEETTASALPMEQRPLEVLVVSSTSDPAGLSDLTVALAGALPSAWTVRFRPHPAERATMAAIYPNLLSREGIVIDLNSDVTDSLRAARAVVGVSSTVLYEAVAMGCRVFAIASPMAPYYVGDLFGELIEGAPGVQRIAREVTSATDARVAAASPADEIWRPGARENFARWALERLGSGAD